MKITFLQAYNGDSIHIEHNGRHVIIDGGPKCEELESVVKNIVSNQEKIDLLIITHYDEDHILGIYNILLKLSSTESLKDLIGEVWFNATKIGYKGNPHSLSANQARNLSDLLIRSDVNWISEVTCGNQFHFDDNAWLEVLYGGEIFDAMSENRYLGGVSCDWDTPLPVLESYVDDLVLDKSKTNSESIIIVVHVGDGKQVLLPGDATPDKLLTALQDYVDGGNSNCFSLFKLPHHGSYRNLTKDILGTSECDEYMICSNGDKHFLPNKKTLLKVSKWGRKSNGDKFLFHFNYFDELFPKLNISEQDMKNYHIACDGQRCFEF